MSEVYIAVLHSLHYIEKDCFILQQYTSNVLGDSIKKYKQLIFIKSEKN